MIVDVTIGPRHGERRFDSEALDAIIRKMKREAKIGMERRMAALNGTDDDAEILAVPTRGAEPSAIR